MMMSVLLHADFNLVFVIYNVVQKTNPVIFHYVLLTLSGVFHNEAKIIKCHLHRVYL